jgi:hypothetical protein
MPRALSASIVLIAALSASVVGGCNIAGPIFFFAHGPEKTKKVHALEPDRPTVVFIDDRHNRVPRRALRIAMAEEAERTLLKTKTVRDMIAGESALSAAGNDRTGRPLPISDIGQAVQAEVVIYVTVDQFALTTDGATFAPTARLRVKVIDVHNESRSWPDEPLGYPVLVRPQSTSRDLPASIADRFRAEEELARRAGVHIAQLFHDHERPRGARMPD